ncbi:unnamed protein product [Ilex paraguariensis]|uniref:Prolamin-like domain-containing protein n=1 Tax=Ilex paraguariensis TaxID=185542 RepID=A0ABC8SF71_9AQUA
MAKMVSAITLLFLAFMAMSTRQALAINVPYIDYILPPRPSRTWNYNVMPIPRRPLLGYPVGHEADCRAAHHKVHSCVHKPHGTLSDENCCNVIAEYREDCLPAELVHMKEKFLHYLIRHQCVPGHSTADPSLGA